MVKILRDRYLWFLVALAVVIGALSYAADIITLMELGPHEQWELAFFEALHRFFYLLVAAIASWRFGLKGGLVACFILGQIILSPHLREMWQPAMWVEIGIIILGFVISWLISKYEKGRELLKRTIVELGQQTKELVQEITERQQAEELFKSLALSSPVGVYIVQEGKFCYTNPRFQKDSGYSEEELLSMESLKLVVPEDRGAVRESAIGALKGKRSASCEYRVVTKDKGIKWALETVAPIQYQGKRATLGNFVDITERKQAEDELKVRAKILDSATDSIFLHDFEGNFIYINETACNVHGYSREEFMKMKLHQLVAPEKVGEIELSFKEMLEKGEGIFDSAHLCKDGSIISAEIHGRTIESGGRKLILTVVRDVTERKRNEERLKEAAEEWSTTFDSINDLVSIVDKDFRLVRVNEAFANTFDMKPEELIGKCCCTLVHGSDEPTPTCPYKVTTETNEPAIDEFFAPHLGVHLEVSTSPIFNEAGKVTACVHIARDITERKKMQEQLIVTDRLASVGELASGVAHELNNPLTGVIGFSQLLLERDVADDVKEDVKVIYREAQRTADVVKNLLTFARKHAPVKELVSINSIVDKVLELRAYEHRINDIQVIVQIDPDLPEVIADYFQIQQVFLNIIINAEHFMIEAHGSGNLTITTEKVGDVVRASFADDGPGIPKENLGHLFDPFFTTKEVGKGTGLGLSICHGIITEHGGRMYAESVLGEGATFVVELPINNR